MFEKNGYVCYDADCSNGDDRRVVFRCKKGITVDDVFDVVAVLVHRSDFIYDAIADLGVALSADEYISAVIDCQRGYADFWVNIILTDAGVQIYLSDKELDACDLPTDLWEFSEYLRSNFEKYR